MANFPSSLPAAGSAITTATLAAAGHTALHNNLANEVVAIATKLGTGASTAANGQALMGSGAGTSVYRALTSADVGLGSVTNISISSIYPVGAIYISTLSTNPATLLGFGTWTAFAAGKVLVGVDSGDATFSAGNTGGEKTHTLIISEMPSHTHPTAPGTSDPITSATVAAGGAITSTTNAGTTGSTGGDGAHNNLQPYIAVYMWLRTV